MKLTKLFGICTKGVSTPTAMYLAILSLLLYLSGGILWGFSEKYNLVANTFMSAVSFLMLFLIQVTSYRSSQILETKIDELILAVKDARNEMLTLEEKDDEEIQEIRQDLINRGLTKSNDL